MKFSRALRLTESNDIDYGNHGGDLVIEAVRRFVEDHIANGVVDHVVADGPLPRGLGGRYVYYGDPGGRFVRTAVWVNQDLDDVIAKIRHVFPEWRPGSEDLSWTNRQDKYDANHRYIVLPVAVLPERLVREINDHRSHGVTESTDIDYGADKIPASKFMGSEQLMTHDPREFADRWFQERFGSRYHGVDYASPLSFGNLFVYRADPSIDDAKHPSYIFFVPATRTVRGGFRATDPRDFDANVTKRLGQMFTSAEVPVARRFMETSQEPRFAVLDYDAVLDAFRTMDRTGSST